MKYFYVKEKDFFLRLPYKSQIILNKIIWGNQNAFGRALAYDDNDIQWKVEKSSINPKRLAVLIGEGFGYLHEILDTLL